MNRKLMRVGCMITAVSLLLGEGMINVSANDNSNPSVLISEAFDINGGDQINGDFSAELVLDKNPDTYWSVYSDAVKGQIVIDLGKATDINTIKILDKNAKISDYSFEYSQNLSQWNELTSGESQGKEEKVDVFPKVNARYVKICINECRDDEGNGGFDIGEIEIYYDSSVNVKAEKTGKKLYKDVNGDSTFGKAIQLLTKLGIVSGDDDGYFKPNAKVTRGEFARMITNIWSENMRINGDMPFEDVSDETWLKEAVANVYGYGIMEGDDNSKFRPNDTITGAEAAKALITLLCRNTQMSEYLGDFPNGYFRQASQIGMLDNTEVGINEQITRKQAAKMIANILDVNLLDIKSTDGGKVTYGTSDETILTKYRSIYNSKGIIVANEFTGIDTKGGVQHGTVEILDTDGTENVFNVGNTDADEKIGIGVSYYYNLDKESEEKTLLAVEEYKTTDVEFDCDDFEKIANDTITYYDGVKKKTQRILPTASVIKNGVYMGKLAHALTNEDLRVKSGYITLVDNDNDLKSDVIFIKSFETSIVDSVSELKNKIFLKNTSSMDFDFDSNLNKIIKDDVEIKSEDLKEYDVVSVMKSDDGESKILYVSTYQPIEGAIEQYSSDDVTVDGIEYKLSDKVNFDGTVYSDEEMQSKLKTMSAVTVYLNFRQEIAGIFSRDVKEQYGYVLKGGYDDIEENMYLKIFNQGGKITKYITGEKVKINGTRMTAQEAYGTLSSGTAVKKQMVRFSTNSENLLTDIILPDLTAGANDKAYEGDNSLIPYGDSETFKSQRFYWKKGLANADEGIKEFSVSNDTIIMQIPTDGNEKNFRILTRDVFQDSTEYEVMAYNVNKTGEAAVVAINLSAAEEVRNDIITYMVTNVLETVDENNDVVTKLECVSQGKELSILCDENTVVYQLDVAEDGKVQEDSRTELTTENIQAGALIQYSGAATANSIRLVYPKKLDYNKPDAPWNFAYGWSAERVFGKVYAANGSKLAVKTGSSMSYYALDENLKFHVWNARTKTSEEGNFADILTVENVGEDEASYFYYAPYTKSMFIFNY